MKKRSIYLFLVCFLPQLLTAQQKSENTITSIVKTQLENELSKGEIQNLELNVKSFHKSKQSNLEHYYFQQSYKGIEINGTESSIHLKPDGSIFKFNNSVQKGLSSASKTPQQPSIDPIQAIQKVANQLNYKTTGKLEVLEHSALTNRSQKISKGSLSRRPIPVKLVYTIGSNDDLILAWDLSIYETRQEEWWSFKVDANSGKIIDQVSWILSCNFDHGNGTHKCTDQTRETKTFEGLPLEKQSNHRTGTMFNEDKEEKTGFVGGYRVFPMPIAHPGDGTRSLVTNPDNATASPFGWHDTNGVPGPEFLTTQGNNVYALDAGNNPGYAPNGGTGLVFDFPLDLSLDPDLFEDAAQTNLFYWNNIAHDVLYHYGFDESSGNFQENNYGKGGASNDFVNANSQISQRCNATFGTPPDGTSPTMSMYLCNGRDGNFSNAVILHEYAHGLSNRLTGGRYSNGCLLNEEQMGEGWSDYIGLILTMKSGDQGTQAQPIGEWLFDRPNGIRPHPYSTDMAINPHTYANSFSGTLVPHGTGSVWCVMLWDMTWDLIAQYGFDADFYNGTGGNNIALQLVVEGMKLQPCSPGFVDGRDAILAADQALYGGANQCLIWNAFSKRGLGANAAQGDTDSRADGVEAFNIPPSCGGTDCLLNTDNAAISVDYTATSNNQVNVTSDGFWTVTSDPSITLLTTSGTGNGTIFFNVAANPNFRERIDTIKITCPDFTRNFIVKQLAKPCNQQYASIPYFMDFESGTLDNFWCPTSTTSFGRIDVTNAYSPRNSRHLVMSAVPRPYTTTTNTPSLGVNLLGKTNVELSFWWKETIVQNYFSGGVFLSDDAGQNFVKVFDLEGGDLTYSKAVLNISQLAVDNGLSLTSTFIIKFEHVDFNTTSRPIAIDDISIQSVTCNLGSPCNDNDPCTINDVYVTFCACSGTFQDTDGDGVCDVNDQCPGSDDTIDFDGDGIPDGCDPVVFCGCSNTITTFPHVEDFEAGDGGICHYSGDADRWFITTGPTSTPDTGPNAAYQGVNCLFIESSLSTSPAPIDRTAFDGACYTLPGADYASIDFWYHMYGLYMGTLNLEVTSNQGATWTTIWSLSGDQGDQWFNVTIDISNYTGGPFSYRFTGIQPTFSPTSDFAVDQITVDVGNLNCTPGTPCNDNNPCTINDKYRFDCICDGTFEDTDLDGTCDAQDQCPGYDDKIDYDADAIPDACDPTVFCGSCSTQGSPPNTHLQFDGVDDYISLNNMDVASNAITLEALINSANLSNCANDQCRIISKASSPTPNDHYWMLSTTTSGANTVLRFRLKTNDNQPTTTLVASAGALSENTWYHVAATYDGSTMRLFVDGALVGSTPKTGSLSINSSVDAWIGGNLPTPTSNPWNGRIDEVRIWNTARSQNELLANRNDELTGTETGLQAYYKFNEGSGQTLNDAAGNNNTVLGSTSNSDTNDPLFVNNSNLNGLIDIFPHTEDFEAGSGSICQYQGDDFDWTIIGGSTPSNDTGPSSAYQGSKYIYVEATPNRDKISIFQGECYDMTGINTANMTFWCHMYGSQMGTLNLEVTSDEGASWTNIWSLSGDQGDNWFLVTIDISNYTGGYFSYRFSGITTLDYRSDIALDQITVRLDCTLGASCDDNDPCTINDVINANCLCVGTFEDTDLDGVCNAQDQCPGYNDTIDFDGDAIPDACDQTVFCGDCASVINSYPHTEGFENGYNAICQYQGDGFDWFILSGPTPSSGTGPDSAFQGSNYLYAESGSNREKMAVFQSECYDMTGINVAYIDFWAHMYGPYYMGTVNLEVTNDQGATWTTVWSLSGDQGNIWFNIVIDVSNYTGGMFSYRFTGITTNSVASDFALDQITVYSQLPCAPGTPCDDNYICTINDTYDAFCQCAGTYVDTDLDGVCDPLDTCPLVDNSIDIDGDGISDCLDPNVFCGGCSASINNYPHTEDFEAGQGICQYQGDYFDWAVLSGPTPSNNTGPSSAYQGLNYFYIETSGGNHPDKIASFQSACYDMVGVNKASIDFWYHMYGVAMGTLNLDVTTDQGDSWTTIWSLSGDQGDNWYNANINLDNYTGGTFSYRFTARTDFSYTSDFALDQITVDVDLSCVPGTSCDDNDPCTINDVYDSLCVCAGTFADTDLDGICDAQDPCPLLDNSFDFDSDGVADCFDPNVFCGNCTTTPATLPNNHVQFDGINDFISLNNMDVSSNAITLEALVYSANLSNCANDQCRIISKAISPTPNDHYWMLSTTTSGANTVLRFRLKTNDGQSTTTLVATTGALSNNTWYHVAATYDGSTMRLFLNGTQVGSTPKTGSVSTNPTVDALIGGNLPTPTSNPWNGRIDEVRIWNTARNQIELQENSNKELTGNEAGLQAYYQFNEGSGQTISDAAGNNNTVLGSTSSSDTNDPLFIIINNPNPTVIDMFPHTENFEAGQGAICQYQGDDFDWIINSGGTNTPYTGPDAAYQGVNYFYMEASSPNYPNKAAAFQSGCYDMVGVSTASIDFWYHMFGLHIGTLNLEVTTDQGNTWVSIWRLSDNQGLKWYNANIDLSNYTGGTFSYRFTGTTESSGYSDIALDQITIDVGTNPTPSLTFDLKAVLEGPYDQLTGRMRSDLYQLELLPGMLFTMPNQIGQETPPGQPYSIPPWNYPGTEGQTYSNNDYDPTSVDWVLMSLRTGVDATTEIHQAAGILKEDGTIEFLPGSAYQGNVPGPYYVLIEHRNHIGALSSQAIMPQNGVLSYDFSTQNSWVSVGFGQKQLLSGLWGLFAADGDQISDLVSYDINGADRILWNADNGIFNEYRASDFDLNGETTGADRILWNQNTGINSGVPK